MFETCIRHTSMTNSKVITFYISQSTETLRSQGAHLPNDFRPHLFVKFTPPPTILSAELVLAELSQVWDVCFHQRLAQMLFAPNPCNRSLAFPSPRSFLVLVTILLSPTQLCEFTTDEEGIFTGLRLWFTSSGVV